jgi:hypothetical protein
MKFPIDTSAMGFIAAGGPEPVVDYDSRRPKTDENGVPLYSVAVMAMSEGVAEVIVIKTPGEPKGITAGTLLRLVGLTGLPWAMEGGRSGVSFRAARMEVARPDARSGPEHKPGS